MTGFAIVRADDVANPYDGTDVPGEFRKLTDALGAVAKGTITFRCGDEVEKVTAPAVVRVSPGTTRSHRNEGD
jgi:hypothetical protein